MSRTKQDSRAKFWIHGKRQVAFVLEISQAGMLRETRKSDSREVDTLVELPSTLSDRYLQNDSPMGFLHSGSNI